jgi:signal peptidase I
MTPFVRNPARPWFAAALSLVMPGLGQLANGEINKAIWLFLCFAVASVPGVALVALYVPSGWMLPALLIGLAITIGTWLYSVGSAWRGARGSTGPFARPWQTSGVYALVFAIGNLVALPFLVGYVRTNQVEAIRVPSSSMAPTVLAGDRLFADKRYNCPGCGHSAQRGDVAIFIYPNDRSSLYIKRIVGLPGDRVQITGHELRVNEKLLGADGKSERIDGKQWNVTWSHTEAAPLDVTVPPAEVFVLGDNRDESADSRRFGAVPLRDVVGRARQVWFSHGAGGVRWDRLGLVLE